MDRVKVGYLERTIFYDLLNLGTVEPCFMVILVIQLLYN